MAAVEGKHWAESYVNDPLTAPEPAAETGPGTSFRFPAPSSQHAHSPKLPKTPPSSNASQLASNNPFRDSMSGKHSRNTSSGSRRGPPPSSHRAVLNDSPQRSLSTRSADSPRTPASGRPRRSSSLRARYPGDNSIHPLDQLSREHRAADRSPHLKKKHTQGKDSIDKLDDSAFLGYHHEGPYDAASLARNNSFGSSPVIALAHSNNETIRATPSERVLDSIRKHRPLEGVAQYPPGTTDPLGHTYEYEEGTDMMRDGYWNDGSPYKRWPDVEYDDDDLKGKGKGDGWNADPKGLGFWENEKRKKERKAAHRSGHGEAVELIERSPTTKEGRKSGSVHELELNGDAGAAAASSTARMTNGHSHSNGHGHSLSGELKRRMGSLKLKGRNKDD